MNRKALISTFIMAGAALAVNAGAQSLKFIGTDYSGTLSGNVTYTNGSGTHTEDVEIGKLLFTDGKVDIATVCADLSSPLNGSYNTYSKSTTNPAGSSALDLAGRIVAADFNSSTNANSGAALQIAVWDALYYDGSSFNASTKAFEVSGISSSVMAQAAADYNAAVGTKTGAATYYSIAANCGGQSQLTAPPSTPEPCSMAALGVGFVGLIARRRRSKA
jgi:hypothetical protein